MIIFDENFSKRFAEGLNHLEEGNIDSSEIIKVTHINTLAGGVGTLDEDVIKIAGENTATIFTQDTDFKRIKHYYQLYKTHKVGVVFFRPSKDIGSKGYWGTVKTLINNWHEIKEKISKKKPPFAFQVDKKGVTEIHF